MNPKQFKRRKSHEYQLNHNLKHSSLYNIHITLYKLVDKRKNTDDLGHNENDNNNFEERPESVAVNQIINVDSLDSSVLVNLNCGLKSLLPTMKNTMVGF